MPYEVGQFFVNNERQILAYVYKIYDATRNSSKQYEVKVYFRDTIGFFVNYHQPFDVQNVNVSDGGRQVLAYTMFDENELTQVIAHYGLQPFLIANLEQCHWIEPHHYGLIRRDVENQVRLRSLETGGQGLYVRLRLA